MFVGVSRRWLPPPRWHYFHGHLAVCLSVYLLAGLRKYYLILIKKIERCISVQLRWLLTCQRQLIDDFLNWILLLRLRAEFMCHKNTE